MLSHCSIFDEPHHQSLELLALSALNAGDAALAFKLADRRCRIAPLPGARSYVLRAEAAFQMGNTGAAIADLTRALEFAPEDLAANRRMLAWARGERQHDAARALLRVERDFEVLRKAIDVLRRNGNTAFANVMVLDEAIEGWAVWEGNDSVEIAMTAEAESTTRLLDGDPRHPLRDFGWAASFTLRRPKWRGAQSIRISLAGKQFYSARAPGDQHKRVGSSNATVRSGRDPQITVIVPVFGDYQATRACLESLHGNLQEAVRHRAILVNDATPDRRIENYLVELGHQPGFELLTNATNLGFVGSVNRALERTAAGDVVLLNSDTIVPPSFLERLAAAAHLSADIGTVMPLSNNGDLAGFPVPNTVTPLGSHQEVTRIDAIAAQTNAGQVIDIPNGIGFCLYITRACLDAVGLLSEDYDRGYLEDADFCLRAREAGFRNVCAPSVYVGHAGSRSFVAEKSFLVSRNLRTLEQRFPKYRFEYGAFSLLDSIRPCREAIERAAGCDLIGPRLLVTGAGLIGAVARERARVLASGGHASLILELRIGSDGPVAHLINTGAALPQQLRFALSSTSERAAFSDYVKNLRLSRIEILDPAKVAIPVLELLIELRFPYDIFIADAGLFDPGGGQFRLAGTAPIRRVGSSRAELLAPFQDPSARSGRWARIVAGAELILLPCERASALARRFLSERNLCRIGYSSTAKRALEAPSSGPVYHLGLVALESCAEEQWLLKQLVCLLRRALPDLLLTIIGATLDDLGLIRTGNTFVTGAIDAAEINEVARTYDIQALFISVTRPLFGHPLLDRAFNCSLPIAFFDWSRGGYKPRTGDVGLDPSSSVADVVARIESWIAETHNPIT